MSFHGDSSDDLYQIAILIDQLKHDDIQFRIAASKSICKIASSLGSERTREEFIPFLGESNDDDDDEVLQIIAEKLGELVDFVGGKDHTYVLLKPLESLASVEDQKVRDIVITSINKVSDRMPQDQLTSHFVPLISRLAKKDCFTSRTSAVALIHTCYERLTEEDKAQMKVLFLKLCSDDTPSVRRCVALQFTKIISKLNRDDKKDFLSNLNILASDDQDSVRIQSVCSYILISKIIDSELYATDLMTIVCKSSGDISWRVRRSVASQLHILLSVINDDKSVKSISDIYISLLNDTESEVRATAAACLSLVAKSFSKDDIVDNFIPHIQKLAKDEIENVRSSLAVALNDVAALIAKDATIEFILPIVLSLLRDEVSEVRLSVISNLGKLNNVIGLDLLGQSLIPTIVELTEDSNWRVRSSIIDHMPMLAQHFGQNFFKEKLNSVCLNLLKDNVFFVRKAAILNIQNLVIKMGDAWSSTEILPYIQNLQTDSSYSNRLTALKCFQLLLFTVELPSFKKIIMNAVMSMCEDIVPNIRFIAIKTLQQYLTGSVPSTVSSADSSSATTVGGKAGPAKDPTVIGDVKKSISKLMNDPDRDVRYFANKAMHEM